MAERSFDHLFQRHAELAMRLEQLESPADLEPLKADIGALFKNVDREITELTTLKANILELVEKWKVVRGAQPASIAPTFSSERPIVHADHIGDDPRHRKSDIHFLGEGAINAGARIPVKVAHFIGENRLVTDLIGLCFIKIETQGSKRPHDAHPYGNIFSGDHLVGVSQ